MSLFKDLAYIHRHNTFHGRVVIMSLYLEKRFVRPFSTLISIYRRLFIQCTYNCVIHPDSFRSLSSIITLSLPHPYFIVIHKETSIGENAKIYQGVTIGSTEKEGEFHNLAYIGNNVMIGVKSTILGGVKIGDKVRIGAHALVLNDVEKGNTVVGLWK